MQLLLCLDLFVNLTQLVPVNVLIIISELLRFLLDASTVASVFFEATL